ncbi:glycosyltransferase family 2 protein [Arcticibacter tournemirensis]|uniref:Glycosyltransferase n=1 Tax=Arcticibacter tournemirensis TaxID=699437 RepID=A0A4Q0M8H9_9SPHI|nr:glycosyltransferase [Arcticibacter tournemirensis]RXF69099.1 glycosyltransferase [Arcticibacter tournemirensis]
MYTQDNQDSIDIVIPSYRLDESILLPIFGLQQPVGFIIKYYLISDNPAVSIPSSILQLATAGKIVLIVNEKNLGFSPTRNLGIDAGRGEWILLLDDDIIPAPGLLLNYAYAIKNYPGSIGFIGLTSFPEPFNDVTKALFYNGSVGHFQSALKSEQLPWAPTANVLLNRKLLGNRRFDPSLKLGGEDIELLAGNSLARGMRYISVPKAEVVHPWWNGGKQQLRRLFRYGAGTAEVMNKKEFRSYAFIDFTNTSETLLLLLVLIVAGSIFGVNVRFLIWMLPVAVIAELITCIVRGVKISGEFAAGLLWQMLLHKNMYEAGMLWNTLSNGRLHNFARRIDLGFAKKNPSPFRLNKWKIIKLTITIIMIITCILLT